MVDFEEIGEQIRTAELTEMLPIFAQGICDALTNKYGYTEMYNDINEFIIPVIKEKTANISRELWFEFVVAARQCTLPYKPSAIGYIARIICEQFDIPVITGVPKYGVDVHTLLAGVLLAKEGKIVYPHDVYRCDKCNAMYISKGALTNHIRSKHSGKIIPGHITKDDLIVHHLAEILHGYHDATMDTGFQRSQPTNMLTVGARYDSDIQVSNEVVRNFPYASIRYGIWNPDPLTLPNIIVEKRIETEALASASYLDTEHWLAIKLKLCADTVDWNDVLVTSNLLNQVKKAEAAKK